MSQRKPSPAGFSWLPICGAKTPTAIPAATAINAWARPAGCACLRRGRSAIVGGRAGPSQEVSDGNLGADERA